MSNKDLFLSIIVPVYNVEEYLEECLDSLLYQNISHEQYEIICVNDGSTDKSVEILNNYTYKFENLIVINKENGGVSSARNAGIDIAQGKYLWFVDSDDFIRPNSLFIVSKLLSEDKYDYIKLNSFYFDHEEKFSPANITPEMGQKNRKNLPTYILRREHIIKNKIYFDTNITYTEDAIFMLQLDPFLVCHTSIDDVIYFYRKRPGSAMSQNLNKKIRSRINCALVCDKILQGKQLGNVNAALKFKYISVSRIIGMIVKLPIKERKKYIKDLKSNNLFPLKKTKNIIPSKINKNAKLIKKIQNSLINNSYTRIGYIKLMIFTTFFNIPKIIKSFLNHK